MIENEKFYSVYARVFDKDCAAWMDNRDLNSYFVKATEQHFNDILKYRGYVFLRDIYETFGWPVTKVSINYGWVWNNEVSDRLIKFWVLTSEDKEDPDLIIDFTDVEDITRYFK